jgi:hypothetical protein
MPDGVQGTGLRTSWVQILRSLSWLMAALAYIGVPGFAFWDIRRDEAAQIAASGRPICGNVQMAITVLAVFAVAAFSLLASLFGAPALFKLQRPKPWARILEWVILATPLLISMVIITWGSFFAGL